MPPVLRVHCSLVCVVRRCCGRGALLVERFWADFPLPGVNITLWSRRIWKVLFHHDHIPKGANAHPTWRLRELHPLDARMNHSRRRSRRIRLLGYLSVQARVAVDVSVSHHTNPVSPDWYSRDPFEVGMFATVDLPLPHSADVSTYSERPYSQKFLFLCLEGSIF